MSDKWEFRLGEANALPCPDDCFGALVNDEWVVAEIKSDIPDAQDKADYIVRVLNSHDDLLGALKACRNEIMRTAILYSDKIRTEFEPVRLADDAIKNAEEK